MKTIIVWALILATAGSAYFGGQHIYRAIRQVGYSEAMQAMAAAAEADRKRAQTTINQIEKDAVTEAQKVADQQIASKVEKAISDVRKSNPACSLVVPGSVLDALRKKR